jgi:N-succinyldiaminopimelate aminotransferase
MPRYPEIAPTVAGISSSLYSSLAHRLKDYRGEVYPFHIGDTWKEPATGARMEDLTVAEYPGMHRYSPVQGRRDLLHAIVERTGARTGAPAGPENVLLAAGATGALGAVVGALLEPGEEVLLLAPYWPLIEGIVRSFRGKPVAVPFLGEADSAETAIEIVEGFWTEKAVAIYWNTPNNPTGRVIPGSWIENLVEWAKRRNLWILADEVYEEIVFVGAHRYTRPLAPDQTFSVHSFSKAYGMAGNRCGYAVGPAGKMDEVRKVSTHTFYCAPTAAQIAASRILGGLGDSWIEQAREEYRRIGNNVAAELGVRPPEGSTFLFLDIGELLDERGLRGFLEDCVDHGLLMAPGPSFGPYPHHVRLCYTATPPEVTTRGIAALRQLLSRSPGSAGGVANSPLDRS